MNELILLYDIGSWDPERLSNIHMIAENSWLAVESSLSVFITVWIILIGLHKELVFLHCKRVSLNKIIHTSVIYNSAH